MILPIRSLALPLLVVIAASPDARAQSGANELYFLDPLLDSVTLVVRDDAAGVPPYVWSRFELEAAAFADGDRFEVHTVRGVEEVVFDRSRFTNPDAAAPDEIAAAINEQLEHAVATVVESHLVLRGTEPGVASTLRLVDGLGYPLARLSLPETTVGGSRNLLLEIAPSGTARPPAEHPGGELALHNYFLLASATPGTTPFGPVDLPFAIDALSWNFWFAAGSGLLPGFWGVLDENALGGPAILPTNLVPPGFPLPDLELAYLVVNPNTGVIERVSNRFTLRIR